MKKTLFPYLPEIQRNTVGLIEEFERAFGALNLPTTSYPPYDIIRQSDTQYSIKVAVAGFSLEDLEVIKKENLLEIKGSKKAEEEVNTRTWIHRGIATRDFTLSFLLGKNVEVSNVSLDNGILMIDAEGLVPEEKKPVALEIKTK